MLYLEGGFHAKFGAFFDSERLRFQRFDSTWCAQIDCDVGTIFDLEGKSKDDTASGI